MNERIKELARQAFIKERKESCPDWKENELSDALLKDFEVVFENFAELIIKECLAEIFMSIPDTMCGSSGAYKTARIAAVSAIRDRFQIKE